MATDSIQVGIQSIDANGYIQDGSKKDTVVYFQPVVVTS